MKEINEFDKNLNYYNELVKISSNLQFADEGTRSSILLNRSKMIEFIKENGTEENKYDMYRFLIENDIDTILEENGIILERGLPFKPDDYLEKHQNYLLGCYDDPGQSYSKYSAYFKFFNHKSFNSATKVARITFLNPSYVHHKDPYGKQDWELNNGEREDLNKILHKVINGQTVWGWLCYEFYAMTGLDFDFGIAVPNYMNILPNVDKELLKNDNTIVKKFKGNSRNFKYIQK